MDTDSLKEPVSKDKKDREQTEQEKAVLVKKHTLLIKRIAYHLLGRLPRSVQFEDLIQAGMVGLLEAAAQYDESKGASFETYAGIRIRGHMLDEVRRNDWVPRSVYRNARTIAQAVREVENRYRRDAKDSEIAEVLGIPLDEYHHMLRDSSAAHLHGFEDLGVTDDNLNLSPEGSRTLLEPHKRAQKDELKVQVTDIIDHLPHKEQLVLSLYYEHELNLKEIGDLLEITESRVSQIHSQAMHRIRARLQEID